MPAQPPVPPIDFSAAMYPAIIRLAEFAVPVVVVILLLRGVAGIFKGGAARQFPYRLRDGLLTPAELSFYGVLKPAIGEKFTICPKVRLADLFLVTNNNISSLNRITSKHVDFVLCDPVTMRPALGIELDDSSHQARKRIARDEFVDEVFRRAKLPLLRAPVRQSYNSSDLQTMITNAVQRAQGATLIPEVTRAPEGGRARETTHGLNNAGAPLCPTCGIPLVLRTARRGINSGGQFYGCDNYPECRQITPLIQ